MSNADSDAASFSMTDLGQALKGPDASAIAATILARLDRLEDELETYKRSEATPADYSQAEIIAAAIVAAREIVLRTLTASGTAAH